MTRDPLEDEAKALRARDLAAIAVVSLALHAVAIRNTWGFGQDSFSYLRTAQILASGDASTEWTFRMLHPVYPGLIALVGALVPYELAGRWISAVALTALALVAGASWARRRSRAEGVVLGLAFALHPGALVYSSEIWTESLTLFAAWPVFLVAADARATGGGVAAAAKLGLGCAVLALVKPTGILLLPGALAYAWWPGLRHRAWRRVALDALAFTAAFLPLAIVPHVHAAAVLGQPFDFVARESQVSEDYVDYAGLDAATGGALAGAPHALRKFAANAWSIAALHTPRQLWPWFLVLPLAALGAWRLLRSPGPARDLWICAASGVALEWAVRALYTVNDRYVLTGLLPLLPACATGAFVVGRSVAARLQSPLAARAATLTPAVVLLAVWSYSFVRMHVVGKPLRNDYRSAAETARATLDPPPHRLTAIDPQLCWHLGAERVRFPRGSYATLLRVADESRADGMVAGGDEVDYCPELVEVANVPIGGTWRGLRVAVRVGSVTLLVR